MRDNAADEIEEMFLNKGKKSLFDEYKKTFSDDNRHMRKCDNFDVYMQISSHYKGELNSKILEMLNDKTNGEKYFNNLACILELLNFLSKQSNQTDYSKCIECIKSFKRCYADELTAVIKNFVPTENDHMVVLEDKDGNRFETPGIQICASFNVFEDETSILSCSPDNTCKSDEIYKAQYKNCENISDLDETEKFFKSLQDMVHRMEWECALQKIGITKNDIKNLLSDQRNDLYNNARILTEHDKNEIQFFNMAVRGKGSGDRFDIDDKKHDLFSLFNKKLPFFIKGLSRYHIGGIAPNAINYLFEKVSYNPNNPYAEGYQNNSSVLNEHGKKITERVLKLFLDENTYNVMNKGGNIKVEESICVDKYFDSANEKILAHIKRMNSEKKKELKNYVDKFIDDLNYIMIFNMFDSIRSYNTKNNKSKIDYEIDEIINNICNAARNENRIQNLDNFIFLMKTAVRKRLKYYFSDIEGNERNNTSAIYKIKDEYEGHSKDFFSGIRFNVMSGLRDGDLCLGNKYFDYEKADLKISATLHDFDGEFDEFKNKMQSVFKGKLPETKEEFGQKFEEVDCDELIEFMKTKMEIEIDKNFLKDVLSGFLYSYIDSIYGSTGQSKQKKFLNGVRNYFFSEYLGSTFIKNLEKYLGNICNKPEKMLPEYFYNYDSDESKDHDKPFSPLNYIQTFLYAPLFPDKIFNMSANDCEKLVRNIENIISAIESNSDDKFNRLYIKMRDIRKSNSRLTYPEICLNILLDGVNINLTQEEKLNICRAARDFTNNNLDQAIKEHVTQSNFVKIKKGNEFYKKKSGIIVVPTVNIFANGTFDKLLSLSKIRSEYKNSLANYCDIAWFYLWFYETIGLRILFRIYLILFVLPLILFHGISYIIYFCKVGYAFYKADGRDCVRKFKDPETIKKGRAQYNKLQEWKLKIKEENQNNNIVIDQEKNNLIKINSGVGVRNDIDIEIDNNIIDTSSGKKKFLPLSGSNEDLNQIDNF